MHLLRLTKEFSVKKSPRRPSKQIAWEVRGAISLENLFEDVSIDAETLRSAV